MRLDHLAAIALGLAGAGACGGDGVTVVTLRARPALHDADEVVVTMANANATLAETFPVEGRAFPLTFSIETGGRDGTLELRAEVHDGDGAAIGAGAATVDLDGGRGDVDLMLEPSDFVVNTVFVGDQALAFRAEAGGRQVAVGADGAFTVGWSDSCQVVGRCDVFGRRFDAVGRARATTLAAGTAQFNLNRTNGLVGYEPSLATSSDGVSVAAWSDGNALLAVTIDAEGAATAATETTVATGTGPSTPAVAALPGGRFVVAWTEDGPAAGSFVVKAVWLDDQARPVANPVSGSAAPYVASSTLLPTAAPPALTATGDQAAHAIVWRSGSILRGRFYGASGQPGAAADVAVGTFPGDELGEPQLVAAGADVAVLFARRTSGGDADDGQLVLRRVTTAGSRTGVDAIVTREVELGPMALTSRPDGALAVAWEACGADHDGAGCGIRLQLFRPTLAAVGAPLLANTTTAGDQVDPSLAALPDGAFVAAWSDASRAVPDSDGFGIRARIVYPPYDDATGLGARCTTSAACGDGAVCMPGSDGTARCYRACAADRSCAFGGSCTTMGDESGCLF